MKVSFAYEKNSNGDIICTLSAMPTSEDLDINKRYPTPYIFSFNQMLSQVLHNDWHFQKRDSVTMIYRVENSIEAEELEKELVKKLKKELSKWLLIELPKDMIYVI